VHVANVCRRNNRDVLRRLLTEASAHLDWQFRRSPAGELQHCPPRCAKNNEATIAMQKGCRKPAENPLKKLVSPPGLEPGTPTSKELELPFEIKNILRRKRRNRAKARWNALNRT
jgi:hypothetical protein